jgi:hypothetical protein
MVLAMCWFVERCLFWVREGEKMHESGYVPPRSRFAHPFKNFASNLLCWFGAGPVQVHGMENLKSCSGRILMVIANHQDEWDDALLQKVFPFINRYLAAENQLFGIRNPLAAWNGFVCVKYSQEADGTQKVSNGEVLVDTMTHLLVQDPDACLGIFVQGQLRRSNKLIESQFKTGAVRTFRKVVLKTGDTNMFALPVGFHALRHPDQATRLHRMLRAVGLKFFRGVFGHSNYGFIAVVGKPVPYSALPDTEDARPGTGIFFQAIKECVETAQSMDDHLPEWTESGEPENHSSSSEPQAHSIR